MPNLKDFKELFTPFDHIQFGLWLEERTAVKSEIFLMRFMTVLMVLVLFVAFITEANILYSTFEYLAGEEGGHWSPLIMATTVFVVISTFHLIKKMKPDGALSVFVERCVHVFMPIYLIGGCFYIAYVIFKDGIADMGLLEDLPALGVIPQAIESGFVDFIFEYAIGPLSLLGISIGIGSIAIMNLFLIHHLLVKIFNNIEKVQNYKSDAQSAQREYQIVLDKEKEHNSADHERELLDLMNDDDIRDDVVKKVMDRISDGLRHWKQWLSENKRHRDSHFLVVFLEHDPEQVERFIAEMEAITPEDIMKAIDANMDLGGPVNV